MHRPFFIKPLLLLFFLVIPLLAKAQETITTKDGKQYKATSNWNFTSKNYIYSGILEVQIAKTEKGGILKLGVEVSNESFYIGDTVYLVLQDGSFIVCTDKGIRERKDKRTIAYYYLTSSEMSKLKVMPLTDVRFRIKGKEDSFGSRTGHFTAVNKKSAIETFGMPEEAKSHDTVSEIKALYN